MNKLRTKLLIAMQLCSIMLLTLFVAASANAQSSATAVAKNNNITVPSDLQVPAGNEVFFVGHGVGTQNYVCLPCDPSKPDCHLGVIYTLITPQAVLFNDQKEQVTTHFFSANPFEKDDDPTVFGDHPIRATWQHSRDMSTVWGKVVKSIIVNPDAIPWLKVQVKDVGVQAGPTGGDKLTKTTFIQRVNTVDGLAPSDCAQPSDIGKKAFIHYTADYVFYKAVNNNDASNTHKDN